MSAEKGADLSIPTVSCIFSATAGIITVILRFVVHHRKGNSMTACPQLSPSLSENIKTLHTLLPLEDSFDLISRELFLGKTKCYFLGVNGFCKTDALQLIFAHYKALPSYIPEVRFLCEHKIFSHEYTSELSIKST